MTERIDFALEPGVLITAAAFLVLLNILLGAVLYPYLRESSSQQNHEEDRMGPSLEAGEQTGDAAELDERIDDFLQDMHDQPVESEPQ